MIRRNNKRVPQVAAKRPSWVPCYEAGNYGVMNMTKWAEVVVATTKVFAVEISDDENLEDAENCALEAVEGGGDSEVNSSMLIKDDIGVKQICRLADETIAV